MKYCLRCTYPENARPNIHIDEDGICSGCRVSESKSKINWTSRKKIIKKLLNDYKIKSKKDGSVYDCIIPVSGGKDSHYQVYLIKEVFKLNPLLVTYNHNFNTSVGLKNLENLVSTFNCDLLRVTSNTESVKKLARYMFEKVGDITWHYHTGINTLPFQIAVEKKIPLIIYGDHGYSEHTGMFQLENIPEFTNWCRQQYEMRGIELESIVSDRKSKISIKDLAPFIFPEDNVIQNLGVRGIFLGNYIKWNHLEQVKFLTREKKFSIINSRRARTFSNFHKIDDHANDVHDYLKYLKFGYGRATDHTSEEIRNHRMDRKTAVQIVKIYDDKEPKSLNHYLKYLELSRSTFFSIVNNMRDKKIWNNKKGKWTVKSAVFNTKMDPKLIKKAKLKLVDPPNRTFGKNNKNFFYNCMKNKSEELLIDKSFKIL